MIRSFAQQLVGLATCAAMFSPAFVPVSSGAFDAATILRTPAPAPGELLAFDMTRIVSTQTQLIRYEATEYQRKVAESRARAFMAAHRRAVAAAKPSPPKKEVPRKSPKSKEPETPVAQKHQAEPKAPEKGKKGSQIAEKPSKETPVESKAKKEPKVGEKPAELPRYIAVDTVKDKRAAPGTKKVVMIWDTHAETLVGNNIYDVQNPPRVGETKMFETYSAEYIGAGL